MEPSTGRSRAGGAPRLAVAAAVGGLVFAVLVANGRPIVAGDTRPTERVAASLVRSGNVDLDEFPEVREPFARRVGSHYVSIYPILSGVLAVPVFAAADALFPLDERGTALAGKVSAALFSSLAAALLFLTISRRHPWRPAATAAVLFGLGTSVWSTSQALWQHPAAVLFLCLALLFLVLAEDDPVWAGRAGLPLALVVAARYADAAMVVTLALGVVIRWPRQAWRMILWGLAPAAFVAGYHWLYFGSPFRHGFSGTLGRFSGPWGEGHLGLLISPGKGLFVFTPLSLVALAGLVHAWRGGERWLTGWLGASGAAHWVLMGRWMEWHGGQCWGPRMMTDMLPLLWLFLPEGLARLPRLGAALAAVSVGVQALGAFAYEGRWEKLFQDPPAAGHRELWQVASSPIPFHLRERVVILALPGMREGRIVSHRYRLVVFGAVGARVEVSNETLVVRGEPPRFGDVHFLRGARAREGLVRLRSRHDGLFLRARGAGLERPGVLTVRGVGQGHVYVGEGSFLQKTRWSAYPVDGPFVVDHPYDYARSGLGDLTVSIGRARGWVDLEDVELRPAADP